MQSTVLNRKLGKVILKVEIANWITVLINKELWRNFNDPNIRVFYALPFSVCDVPIKIANILLANGIWCRIKDNESYLLELASHWGEGNIVVVPVLEDDIHYLYFVVEE